MRGEKIGVKQMIKNMMYNVSQDDPSGTNELD